MDATICFVYQSIGTPLPKGLFSARASMSKSKFAVADEDEDFQEVPLQTLTRPIYLAYTNRIIFQHYF